MMGHVTRFVVHCLSEDSWKGSLFVCGADMTVLPIILTKTV